MIQSSPSRIALPLMLLALSGCYGEEAQEVPVASVPAIPRIEFVGIREDPKPTVHDSLLYADFKLVNAGSSPIAYRKSNENPVYRHGYLMDGRWVEVEPIWIECGLGLSRGKLNPGQETAFEVLVEHPDLPLRVGVGYWEYPMADIPHPRDWSWLWAEDFEPGSLLPGGDSHATSEHR